ncbi:MAG: phosphatase PAP2 family protein [Spirochaetaceae bacterium]|nr:phosphatase PAP2 family protein [Spirochaetaceae bacterium]
MDESITGLLSPGEGASLRGWYLWGMAFVRAVQGPENPGLTALVKALTLLGSELFYIPAVLFIYWCVDERKGQRLVLLLLLSTWLNTALKDLLKQPRPYFLDPSVGRARASGYGLPSGHAQQSLVFWAAALAPRKPAWIIAGAVSLVMAFTRLYLGVHFPTDLAAGWLLALGILALSALFWVPLGSLPSVGSLLNAGSTRMRMIALAGAAFVMNALYGADRSLGALFLGFGAGYTLMIRSFPFSAAAPGASPLPAWLHRLLRFALGAAGAFLIYRGFGVFRELFAAASSFLGAAELGRFLHYGLLGLWASAGAPWLFLRLRLASYQEQEKQPHTRKS